MRAMSKLLALAFAAAIQPAMADPVILNFNDLLVSGLLTNQYESKGVIFSGAAFGATEARPPQSCLNNPGYVASIFSFNHGCGALLLASDPFGTGSPDPSPDGKATLTVKFATGFEALSFTYSGNVGSTGLEVHVYDENGNPLANAANFSTAACGGNWCTWADPFSLSGFGGRATTVTFTAAEETILLDDLRFTPAAGAPGDLPEPASMALVLAAMGALGWARKRQAR